MKKVIKNTDKPVQIYRTISQIAFVLLCIWIGVEFHLFVKYLETGGVSGSPSRPPGVEGFLPISALMSVYYFLISGEIHSVHPSGFFILLAVIGVSLVFGKSFCSWICPVGFLSESLGDFGDKIWLRLFKRRLKIPRFLDYPLRSLKYLLLAFFVYAIFFTMTELALKVFLDSDYNKVADIKMYYFFAEISRFSLIVISVLFVLSIFIRNFWCRYLCPYGALLGILNFVSPTRIKREPLSCIDCGLCTKACPSFIKVDKVKTVISDECSSCMSCVDACPVKDTLFMSTVIRKKKINKITVALGIIMLFISITGIGMISGNWHNSISTPQYLHHIDNVKNLGHPTGVREIKELNEKSEERNLNEGKKISGK